ncbi:hypothetical protein [Streptomyces marincola]|uniref:hypothetical protein n=1 Tax=Streptomyces marincola TaxID=2878388 RepID=UPI001CF0E1B1|nr:hypothetical protein [Streptomyces marincola]UCM90419.1 hypothetical protein LC193_22175 [Streptomyces marincola]
MSTEPTTPTQAAYQPPTLSDGGPVADVTLGKNGFDVQDNTEYRQKTPGVSAL